MATTQAAPEQSVTDQGDKQVTLAKTRAVDDTFLRNPEMSYFKGVAPNDPMNRMYGFSYAIKDSSFIPPAARGDAGSVFLMVNRAQEMGMNWTVAVNGGLFPIPGQGGSIRLGIEGHVALSLLLARKFKCKVVQSTDDIAEWWIQRPDAEFEFQDSFTYAEATQIGLTKKDNWKYRKDMLRWRALMRTARVVAADLLGGLYLPEELESIEMQPDGNGWSAPAASEPPAEQFPVGRKPAATVTVEPVASTVPETTQSMGTDVVNHKDGDARNNAVDNLEVQTQPAIAEEPPKSVISPCGCVAPNCLRDDGGAKPEGRWCQKELKMKPWLVEKPKEQPPAATPEPTKQPGPELVKDPVKERLAARILVLTDLYPKESSEKVKPKFNTYFRGYFAIEKVSQLPIERGDEAMDQLELAIKNAPDAVWKDPAGYGRSMAADRAEWLKLVEPFSPDIRAIMWRTKIFHGHMAVDQRDFVVNMHIADLPESEQMCFWRLACRVRTAGKLLNTIRQYPEQNITLAEIIESMEAPNVEGKPIEEIPIDKLERLVASSIEKTHEICSAAAASGPPVVEDDSDSLFN